MINDKKKDFSYYLPYHQSSGIIKYIFKSNLTTIDCLFYNCISLISLDLSNFNTENITNMAFLFSGCKSLKSLNLSNFNTLNVRSMSNMFEE